MPDFTSNGDVDAVACIADTNDTFSKIYSTPLLANAACGMRDAWRGFRVSLESAGAVNEPNCTSQREHEMSQRHNSILNV